MSPLYRVDAICYRLPETDLAVGGLLSGPVCFRAYEAQEQQLEQQEVVIETLDHCRVGVVEDNCKNCHEKPIAGSDKRFSHTGHNSRRATTANTKLIEREHNTDPRAEQADEWRGG